MRIVPSRAIEGIRTLEYVEFATLTWIDAAPRTASTLCLVQRGTA